VGLGERVVVVEEEAPDFIELRVMSLCRFIIIANSSFSWCVRCSVLAVCCSELQFVLACCESCAFAV